MASTRSPDPGAAGRGKSPVAPGVRGSPLLSISVVVRKRAGPPTRPGVDQESSTITPTSPPDIAASGDNERHVPNGRTGGCRTPARWKTIEARGSGAGLREPGGVSETVFGSAR